MRQNVNLIPDTASDVAHFHNISAHANQQETMGQVVVEILQAGKTLNRKAICSVLLKRLENAANAHEERHYQSLIAMLF